jgi:hypothetical protein
LYAHRRARRASSGADSEDDIRLNPFLNSKSFFAVVYRRLLTYSV